MLLQAALNGPFTKSRHPALPVTAAELAADALACRDAGAGAFHLHPRDADGIERLAAGVVDGVVRTVLGRARLAATRPLISDAVERGLDTRVGFEDTVLLPDARTAASNAELVAAYELGAGQS